MSQWTFGGCNYKFFGGMDLVKVGKNVYVGFVYRGAWVGSSLTSFHKISFMHKAHKFLRLNALQETCVYMYEVVLLSE